VPQNSADFRRFHLVPGVSTAQAWHISDGFKAHDEHGVPVDGTAGQ
jgi:hypothetical protein